MEDNDRLLQLAAFLGGLVGVAEIFGWPEWPFFKEHIPAITLILIGALLVLISRHVQKQNGAIRDLQAAIGRSDPERLLSLPEKVCAELRDLLHEHLQDTANRLRSLLQTGTYDLPRDLFPDFYRRALEKYRGATFFATSRPSQTGGTPRTGAGAGSGIAGGADAWESSPVEVTQGARLLFLQRRSQHGKDAGGRRFRR